jgi:hypothetical protein
MREFHFEIQYIKREENSVTDYLSQLAGIRCVLVNKSSTSRAHTWMAALEGDHSIAPEAVGPYFPYMQMFKDILHIGLPRCKEFQVGYCLRVVIPWSMHAWLVKEAHNSKIAGHMEFFKTTKSIKECYWWPCMDKDIEPHI